MEQPAEMMTFSLKMWLLLGIKIGPEQSDAFKKIHLSYLCVVCINGLDCFATCCWRSVSNKKFE